MPKNLSCKVNFKIKYFALEQNIRFPYANTRNLPFERTWNSHIFLGKKTKKLLKRFEIKVILYSALFKVYNFTIFMKHNTLNATENIAETWKIYQNDLKYINNFVCIFLKRISVQWQIQIFFLQWILCKFKYIAH